MIQSVKKFVPGDERSVSHPMEKDVKALIVGATSGIGAAIAERMAGHFTTEKERHTKLHLMMPPPHEMDVRLEDDMERYMKNYGPFDQIVYTPGVARLAWAEDLHMQDFRDDFTVNAFGFAILIGKHKKWFPDASLSAVAIVSDAYKNAMRGSMTYCASKAALAAIIRNLAREMAPLSRINGVAPAIVEDTPMTDYIDKTVPVFRGWDPEKAKAYEATLLPMGRRTTKDEVAELVISVLNGPAYMTGSIVEITGGR